MVYRCNKPLDMLKEHIKWQIKITTTFLGLWLNKTTEIRALWYEHEISPDSGCLPREVPALKRVYLRINK